MEVKSKSGDVKWTNLRLESFDSPKYKKKLLYHSSLFSIIFSIAITFYSTKEKKIVFYFFGIRIAYNFNSPIIQHISGICNINVRILTR